MGMKAQRIHLWDSVSAAVAKGSCLMANGCPLKVAKESGLQVEEPWLVREVPLMPQVLVSHSTLSKGFQASNSRHSPEGLPSTQQ